MLIKFILNDVCKYFKNLFNRYMYKYDRNVMIKYFMMVIAFFMIELYFLYTKMSNDWDLKIAEPILAITFVIQTIVIIVLICNLGWYDRVYGGITMLLFILSIAFNIYLLQSAINIKKELENQKLINEVKSRCPYDEKSLEFLSCKKIILDDIEIREKYGF